MKINENIESFREKLEKIKIDIGDFIRMSESISTRNHHKIFRNYTMRLRNSLKEIRQSSLDAEKKMTEILNKAKKEISEKEII